MEKGKTYIVFLSDETASGDMSVISANNGKIDVSSIEDNEFYDIAIKSVIDFEKDWERKFNSSKVVDALK